MFPFYSLNLQFRTCLESNSSNLCFFFNFNFPISRFLHFLRNFYFYSKIRVLLRDFRIYGGESFLLVFALKLIFWMANSHPQLYFILNGCWDNIFALLENWHFNDVPNVAWLLCVGIKKIFCYNYLNFTI